MSFKTDKKINMRYFVKNSFLLSLSMIFVISCKAMETTPLLLAQKKPSSDVTIELKDGATINVQPNTFECLRKVSSTIEHLCEDCEESSGLTLPDVDKSSFTTMLTLIKTTSEREKEKLLKKMGDIALCNLAKSDDG